MTKCHTLAVLVETLRRSSPRVAALLARRALPSSR